MLLQLYDLHFQLLHPLFQTPLILRLPFLQSRPTHLQAEIFHGLFQLPHLLFQIRDAPLHLLHFLAHGLGAGRNGLAGRCGRRCRTGEPLPA